MLFLKIIGWIALIYIVISMPGLVKDIYYMYLKKDTRGDFEEAERGLNPLTKKEFANRIIVVFVVELLIIIGLLTWLL